VTSPASTIPIFDYPHPNHLSLVLSQELRLNIPIFIANMPFIIFLATLCHLGHTFPRLASLRDIIHESVGVIVVQVYGILNDDPIRDLEELGRHIITTLSLACMLHLEFLTRRRMSMTENLGAVAQIVGERILLQGLL
jgi:hypothetical protein